MRFLMTLPAKDLDVPLTVDLVADYEGAPTVLLRLREKGQGGLDVEVRLIWHDLDLETLRAIPEPAFPVSVTPKACIEKPHEWR
jgi:hypothetical protein